MAVLWRLAKERAGLLCPNRTVVEVAETSDDPPLGAETLGGNYYAPQHHARGKFAP